MADTASQSAKQRMQDQQDRDVARVLAFVPTEAWQWVAGKLRALRNGYLDRMATEATPEGKIACGYTAAALTMLLDAPDRVLARAHQAPRTQDELTLPPTAPPDRPTRSPGIMG